MNTSVESDLPLVPQARLGALLLGRRHARSISVEVLAEQSGGIFSAEQLTRFEAGLGTLADKTIFQLSALYELDAGPVIPARAELIVDLDKGRVETGDTITEAELTLPAEILERYLALVYTMRGVTPGQNLDLRVGDIDVLAAALDQERQEVAAKLESLMGSKAVERRSQKISKRVSIPLVGVLVGFTALGALVLAPGSASADLSGDSIATIALNAAQRIQDSSPEDSSTKGLSASNNQKGIAPAGSPTTAKNLQTTSTTRPATSSTDSTEAKPQLGSAITQTAPQTTTAPTTPPTTAPSTTAAPATPPTTATPARDTSPSGMGAAAEAKINYNWRAKLGGWTVKYESSRAGYRGLTDTRTKTITIYVRSSDTASSVADVLAHELGHAVDVSYMNDEKRNTWLEARGMPRTWWAGNGKADFAVGQGDFAEAVAKVIASSPSNSAHGEFSEDQLNLIRQWMP